MTEFAGTQPIGEGTQHAHRRSIVPLRPGYISP
jgi:hypothetical protein